MADFKQVDYALGRPFLAAMYTDGQGRNGLYASPQGYVRIFESRGRHSSTFMLLIHDGRTFSRNWNTTWGDRTLARLAREFVEDVVQ